MAGWLAGAGVLTFIAALIITPTPAAKSGEKDSGSKAALPSAKPTIAAPALTAHQDQALEVIRAATMQVTFCSGEAEMAQAAIDKVGAGRGTEMDAYSAAHIAERDCRKAATELAATENAPFNDADWNEIFDRTIPACRSAVSAGVASMGIAKDVLDGNESLARAQAYKDKRNEMVERIVECKAGLSSLGGRAGIPKEQTDFLHI